MPSFEASLPELVTKRHWVLDVDDCIYAIDSGLHNAIKNNIVTVYNRLATDTPEIGDVVGRILEQQGLTLATPHHIQKSDLGVAFPVIVRALKEQCSQADFTQYLDSFYDVDYSCIDNAPALIDAFTSAHNKGIGIYFYTNGPSSTDPDKWLHCQHVMKALGFDDTTIAFMQDRSYDLLQAIEAGRGKPTHESMQDFLAKFGVEPQHALMADDGPKNLQPAVSDSMHGLWTWTSDSAPKDADRQLAQQLGAPCVRDTGQALYRIANAAGPR